MQTISAIHRVSDAKVEAREAQSHCERSIMRLGTIEQIDDELDVKLILISFVVSFRTKSRLVAFWILIWFMHQLTL